MSVVPEVTEIPASTAPTYYGRTYRINTKLNIINGYIDDINSVKQAVYLILNTERYKYPIYSWDYGVELMNLIGKPMDYIQADLPRRINDALLVDDRIVGTNDYKYEVNGNKLHVSFIVYTNVGDLEAEVEVTV